MLTRSQVAKRLRRSVATVRKLEGRMLYPTQNDRGVWLFDETEVDDVARDVEEAGRALPVGEEGWAPLPRRQDEDFGEHASVTVPDPWEFEQARRRLREHRLEIAALHERVNSLEADADINGGDEDDDDDADRSSHGGALLLLLLGALGLGLLVLKDARPSATDPSRG